MSRTDRIAAASLEEILDPAHSALVLIDVQNDFCAPDGACAGVGDDLQVIPQMVDRIKPLLAAARSMGMLIVFVRASYDPIVLSPPWMDQLNARRRFTGGICREGSAGIEFYEGTGPIDSPKEIVVTKHRYSAFWGTDIDLVLRSNGISTIVLAGVATECCSESTARDAFFRDYRVVTVADGMASYSQERHGASLKVLAYYFGPVMSADAVIEIWKQHGVPRRPPGDAAANAAAGELFAREDTALLLVGTQNDHCSAKGGAANAGMGVRAIERCLPRVAAVMAAARRGKSLVCHLHLVDRPGTRSAGAPRGERRLCTEGSAGAAPAAGFAPAADEPLIIAHRQTGFVDTRLDLLLRSNGIRNLVLAGVTTSGLVDSTAREASVRDYRTWVVEDGVANFDIDESLHGPSLEILRRGVATVASSDAYLGAAQGG